MEKAIDRTAYRRNTVVAKNVKIENNEQAQKKIKKFLYQSLISSLIFLFVVIARRYNIEPILAWVGENIKTPTNVVETYKYVQTKFVELKEYINKIDVANFDESRNDLTLPEDSSSVSENTIDEGIDNTKFEETVEGVNQMIDDANYIKENYDLKHAVQGTVTSIFGVRESENKIVTPYHYGIDVAANKGTNICAAIGGEVTAATTDDAYGKYIMIQTDNLVTLYAHCSELKVKKGQKIKQGEVIGKVGSTGWATGPHLHFEIRLDGRLVNPADVLDYSKMGAK